MQKIELRKRKVQGDNQTKVVIKSSNGELILSGENLHNYNDAVNMLNNLISDFKSDKFRVFKVTGYGKNILEDEVTYEFITIEEET